MERGTPARASEGHVVFVRSLDFILKVLRKLLRDLRRKDAVI